MHTMHRNQALLNNSTTPQGPAQRFERLGLARKRLLPPPPLGSPVELVQESNQIPKIGTVKSKKSYKLCKDDQKNLDFFAGEKVSWEAIFSSIFHWLSLHQRYGWRRVSFGG